MPSEPRSRPFLVDEELLRQAVLRAYREKRAAGERSKRALDAIRQFLSGAPGAAHASRYWFEEDPPASIASFVEDLEKAVPSLPRTVFGPIVLQAKEARQAKRNELAPNLAVYVSSLAGAVAVKSDIDETLACGLIAATILGISKLGVEPFDEALPPTE